MSDLPQPPDPVQQGAPVLREPLLRRLAPVPFVLLTLGLIFFLYQFVGGLIVVLLARGSLTGLDVGLARWSTFFGQIIFMLVPTILLARSRYGSAHLRTLFRIRIPHIRQLAVTMVATFALQQILQTYMIYQDSLPLPQDLQKVVDLFKKVIEETYRALVLARSPFEFIFVLVVVALVPAISEELLFRGLVQRNLEEAAGGLRGAVLAGVMFGLYHLNPFGLVPLIALGVFFGFIVYRSDNITLAMSAHFFNNFVACAAVYLQLDENFIVIAPGTRPSSSLIAVNLAFFAVVFVGATAYFVHSTDHGNSDRESL